MNKDQIIKQMEFQDLVGVKIDDLSELERSTLSEKYLFKAIEEIIELRKTFPSGFFLEKNTPDFDRDALLREFVDAQLFLANFGILWKIDEEELSRTIDWVQNNNFTKMKKKALIAFNLGLISLEKPDNLDVGFDWKIGIGRGAINPRFFIVAQNAAQTIRHGEEVFKLEYKDDKVAGNILLEGLDKLGILDQCYFTNAVKHATPKNRAPTQSERRFWNSYLSEEYGILLANNENMVVMPLGKTAQEMCGTVGLYHPSAVFYGTLTREKYFEQLKEFVEKHDTSA